MNYLNEYKNTPMPFGKYKGQSMQYVPNDYLTWLADKTKDLGLKTMCMVELKRRIK